VIRPTIKTMTNAKSKRAINRRVLEKRFSIKPGFPKFGVQGDIDAYYPEKPCSSST
jgi:hypothetical protein